MIASTGSVAHCLNAGGMGRIDYETETMIAHTLLGKENDSHAADLDTYVAHSLRAEGFDASEDGTGRGTPIIPIYSITQDSTPIVGEGVSPALKLGTGLDMGQPPAVAFDLRGREGGAQFEGPHETANIRAASGGSSRSYVAAAWAVRRLTPRECERLQGFPDGYTDIKDTTPDGPRYKALGNSMAVNCMRWLGTRIGMVQQLANEIERSAAA